MEGKLYTAQEVFDAIQEAVVRAHSDGDVLKAIMVAKIGADIAYEVVDILGIDKEKTVEYLRKKMEKAADGIEKHEED